MSGVDDAVSAAMQAPERVLAAMYEAVLAYHESKDPAVLIEFAEAARLTAIVHSAPNYAKTLENAPHRAGDPGRSLADIFAGHPANCRVPEASAALDSSQIPRFFALAAEFVRSRGANDGDRSFD